jgi:hypothetical protein
MMADATRRRIPTTSPKTSTVATTPIMSLAEIESLAESGKLDVLLAAHDVAEFRPEPSPKKPRKFSAIEQFDRSTFDYDAYSARLEAQLKK